jgi:pimeloyl-ACP methyl ester carboxylesterase
MPELVADVLAVVDRLGGGRVHLVGHDWGGVVAWNLAGQASERVATLTAISTPHPKAFARALWSSSQLLRSAYIGFFGMPWLPELVLGAQRQRGLRFLLAGSGLDPEWIHTYTDALGQPGALAAALAWYRAATPFSVGGPHVAVPTLYVWGSRDPALGPTAARATGRWVTGPYRFEVLPGAGHWLPEQHPEQLTRLLLAHLQDAGVPAGGLGRDG